MNLYVDGVLTPPADAGSLDGVPAALQPVGPAVDGYVVTYDDATGDLALQPGGGFDVPMPISGFAADGGTAGGTADAATGTLTLPGASTTATWAETPRLTRALPIDPFAYEVAVRLVAFTNGTINQQASLRIAHTAATLNLLNALSTFRAFGDGGYDFWTGGGGPASANYSAGTISFDGLTWVRVRCAYGLVTFWTGRGATYAAAVWTLRSCRVVGIVVPVSEATLTDISFTVDSQLGGGGVKTAQWADLSLRSLP